jgi:hypothetical protein
MRLCCAEAETKNHQHTLGIQKIIAHNKNAPSRRHAILVTVSFLPDLYKILITFVPF